VSIKKITKALLYAETGSASQVGPMALTKTASTTFEGETVANRQYLATGRGPWCKRTGYTPVIRISGVVSGCVVSGGSSDDNLEVTAGVVNVNGAAVTVDAGTSNTVTRGASGKYAVHALCVDNTGTLSVVKGTDGDSLDLTSGYGGAGQKPLVATTLAVLAYAVTLGDSAAVIPSADIYAGESANVDYIIDSLRGGIVLYEALPLNHTGPVSRAIYATFYDLSTALSAVATLEDATLNVKKASPVATPNHSTNWDTYASVPTIGWELSAKKWRSDDYWVEKMIDPNADEFYLKMTENTGDTKSFYGFGILNGDMAISAKKGPVSESLKFTGNGELIHS